MSRYYVYTPLGTIPIEAEKIGRRRMRLINADELMETLDINSMDCEKCKWGHKKNLGLGYVCGRGGDFEDACFAIEHAPTIEPDRSLWFRIGEICVDESKGFISSGRAVEKIRELLREAESRGK